MNDGGLHRIELLLVDEPAAVIELDERECELGVLLACRVSRAAIFSIVVSTVLISLAVGAVRTDVVHDAANSMIARAKDVRLIVPPDEVLLQTCEWRR
jgi:hypothetical protein